MQVPGYHNIMQNGALDAFFPPEKDSFKHRLQRKVMTIHFIRMLGEVMRLDCILPPLLPMSLWQRACLGSTWAAWAASHLPAATSIRALTWHT